MVKTKVQQLLIYLNHNKRIDWKSGSMTIDTNIAKCINARVFKMGSLV